MKSNIKKLVVVGDGHVFKTNPSASLSSEENRDLALRVVESSRFVNQGLEELERVAGEISMLVEAVGGTSSRVRRHISNLQAVANLRGTDLRTLLQQCSSAIEQEPTEGHSAPAEAPQPAEAEAPLFAPEPLPWGQG